MAAHRRETPDRSGGPGPGLVSWALCPHMRPWCGRLGILEHHLPPCVLWPSEELDQEGTGFQSKTFRPTSRLGGEVRSQTFGSPLSERILGRCRDASGRKGESGSQGPSWASFHCPLCLHWWRRWAGLGSATPCEPCLSSVSAGAASW